MGHPRLWRAGVYVVVKDLMRDSHSRTRLVPPDPREGRLAEEDSGRVGSRVRILPAHFIVRFDNNLYATFGLKCSQQLYGCRHGIVRETQIITDALRNAFQFLIAARVYWVVVELVHGVSYSLGADRRPPSAAAAGSAA